MARRQDQLEFRIELQEAPVNGKTDGFLAFMGAPGHEDGDAGTDIQFPGDFLLQDGRSPRGQTVVFGVAEDLDFLRQRSQGKNPSRIGFRNHAQTVKARQQTFPEKLRSTVPAE
ncbi:MAG: hypothetical protein A4E72_02226 [Syntrophus sp. PtaU1.Bin208]|nr:MAG: hypothetical protein A4E72_02226 [Syntrophus sp. PtaU1.Bin208]